MSRKNSLKKVAMLLLMTGIVLFVVLMVLKRNHIYVQIGTPPIGIGHQTLSIVLMLLVIVSLVYLIKSRIMIIAGVFILILHALPSMLIEAEYTTFSSPDHEERFVVIEKGYGRLYQLSDSGLYMTYLADIDTDDGFKPFSTGAYQLQWDEPNLLIIQYTFDNMSDSPVRDLIVEYEAE